MRYLVLIVLGGGLLVGMEVGLERVLRFLRGTELVGDLLARKLFSMAFLTFFFFLFFSNVVTALTTFFLSRDVDLLWTAPVARSKLFYGRFVSTIAASSWMVVLAALPVFAAYGRGYGAPAGFYARALVALGGFLLAPAALGCAVAFLLVNVFPAHRVRDFLVLLSILLVVGLVVVFRLIRPERLVEPGSFRTLMDYMVSLRVPETLYLPSAWVSEALLPGLLAEAGGNANLFLGLCLASGAGLVVLAEGLAHLLYAEGISRAQEGRQASRSVGRRFTRLLDWATWGWPPRRKGLAVKEAKVFVRDAAQWSQLLILLAMSFLYLYDFRILGNPKQLFLVSEQFAFELRNIWFPFLNIAMAVLIMSAMAVRFIYPQVSMEGKSFWVIRAAPLSMREFLGIKFWTSLGPVFLLTEALAIACARLMSVEPWVMALTVATTASLAAGLVALALGVGALYPDFQAENPATLSLGWGGLLYMAGSTGLVFAVIAIEWGPAYLLAKSFEGRWAWGGRSLALASGALAVALALPLVAGGVVFRSGVRRLEALDP